MKAQGSTEDVPDYMIRNAAVIGAGAWGSGIAAVFARAGIPVILTDVSRAALDRAMAGIPSMLAAMAQAGGVPIPAGEAGTALIRPTLGFDRIADADLLIEAVPADFELKRDVLHQLDKVCWPEAILATTSVDIDLNRLAAAVSRPFKVIGCRFGSPPHATRLVEIMAGDRTSDDVIAAAMALARRLGKTGVFIGRSRGSAG